MRMVVALIFMFSCLLSWIPGGKSAEVVITRVGGVARFNRTTMNGDNVEWKRILRKEFSTNPILDFIYVNSVLQEKFEIGGRHNVSLDPLTGTCDLVITNVNEDDAGKYVCQDTVGRSYFELVVLLVDDPTCRTNISLTNVLVENDCDIDPDYIEFNCSIAYRGHVAPDMQLQMSSIGVLDNVTIGTWQQSTTKHMSVSWASKASWRMRDGRFRCEVRNTMVGIQPNCSTSNVSILYFYKSNGTQNISLNRDNQAETTFNCSTANTRQTCSFKWQGTYKNSSKASDLSDVSGPTIDLKGRDDEFSSLRCHAECIIRNKSCVSEPVFIEFPPNEGGDSSSKINTPTIAGLIVGLLVIILTFIAIFVIVLCILLRRCRRNREKQRGKETELPRDVTFCTVQGVEECSAAPLLPPVPIDIEHNQNIDSQNCHPAELRDPIPIDIEHNQNIDSQNCHPAELRDPIPIDIEHNQNIDSQDCHPAELRDPIPIDIEHHQNIDSQKCHPAELRDPKSIQQEQTLLSYDTEFKFCSDLDILGGFEKVMTNGKDRELVDYIDPENGLLTELCKLNIIDEPECSELRNTVPYQVCNEKLLKILNSKKNSIDFKQFQIALCGNSQGHIARFILAAGHETVSVEQLLPRILRKVIDVNMYYLKKLINTDKQDLLKKLVEKDCISEQHRITVTRNQKTNSKTRRPDSKPEDQSEALFKILKRRRSKDFWQFIICLRETKQTNVAKILENGGVWEIEVELVERSDRDMIKKKLMDKLTDLVDEDNESELSEVQKVMNNKILAELVKHEIYFIGTWPGISNDDSISVLLQVINPDPCSVLTISCKSGTLKNILEEMFQALLEDPNISTLVEKVKITENPSIKPDEWISICAEMSCKYFALSKVVDISGKIIKRGVFACENCSYFTPTISVPFSDHDHGYVTGMKLYKWTFNGKNEAIAGIEVTYSDSESFFHGSVGYGFKPFKFKLKDQQKIVSADVRCCVLLDALTFKTEHESVLVSTQGEGGQIFHAGPPTSAFLAYLEGTVDTIRGIEVVRNLTLVWEYN